MPFVMEKSEKGASLSKEFAFLTEVHWDILFKIRIINIKSSRYLKVELNHNICLIIVRKRQHEVSLITKHKQICNKRSTIKYP